MNHDSHFPRAGFTRRRLLGYAGAATVSFSLGRFPVEANAVAPGRGLEPQDQQTFKALFEGLAERPGYSLSAAYAGAATTRFNDQYANQNEQTRQGIVAMLRALERGPGQRRFSELDPGERLVFLRGWSHSTDRGLPRDPEDRSRFPSQGVRDRLMASTLVQLVLVPLDPDPVDAPLARQPIEAV